MDIVGGLTAAKLALDLAKDLREIDRSIDEATFKMKIAELMTAPSEAQVALSEAKVRINESDQVASELRKQIDALEKGKYCPKCLKGRLKLKTTEPHYQYGMNHYGVEQWSYRCDDSECGFEKTDVHDPHGALQKFAARK